jgi:hypothetical protein
MRCDACKGTNKVIDWSKPVKLSLPPQYFYMPCPACLNGEVNCCDGICEQPERDDDANNDTR